jgi:hypothetical protein
MLTAPFQTAAIRIAYRRRYRFQTKNIKFERRYHRFIPAFEIDQMVSRMA